MVLAGFPHQNRPCINKAIITLIVWPAEATCIDQVSSQGWPHWSGVQPRLTALIRCPAEADRTDQVTSRDWPHWSGGQPRLTALIRWPAETDRTDQVASRGWPHWSRDQPRLTALIRWPAEAARIDQETSTGYQQGYPTRCRGKHRCTYTIWGSIPPTSRIVIANHWLSQSSSPLSFWASASDPSPFSCASALCFTGSGILIMTRTGSIWYSLTL